MEGCECKEVEKTLFLCLKQRCYSGKIRSRIGTENLETIICQTWD